MNISIEVTENMDIEKVKAFVKGDQVGTYAAAQWLKLYTKFMPSGSTGQLEQNVQINPWEIHHNAPYAHYQYEGIVYGPNIPIVQNGAIVGWYSRSPKQPTGKALKYHGNPRASRHWDEAAIPSEESKLADAVKAYIETNNPGV